MPGSDNLKEIIIDSGITQKKAVMSIDGKTVRLWNDDCFREKNLGDIYLGRIENINEGLGAAFVNIGKPIRGILHREDCPDEMLFKRGGDIAVQIIREGTDLKGPKLTANLSLRGKYTVLVSDKGLISISKKITSENRISEIMTIANELAKEDCGIIIRTEAEKVPNEDIVREYDSLYSNYSELKNKALYSKAPLFLYKNTEDDGYMNWIDENTGIIRTNSEEVFVKVNEYLKSKPYKRSVKLNFDSRDYTVYKETEERFLEGLVRKLELPSGGYVYIDRTEAFTIFDVNSGKNDIEGKGQMTLKVNKEAAIHIVRYCGLYNISGIILIDFIDMNSKDKNKELENMAFREFKAYPQYTRVHGFTRLGILEISRKKEYRSLIESLESGRNLRADFLLRRLEERLKKCFYRDVKNITVYLSSSIFGEEESIIAYFREKVQELYDINMEIRLTDNIEHFSLSEEFSDRKAIEINVNGMVKKGIVTAADDDDGFLGIRIS